MRKVLLIEDDGALKRDLIKDLTENGLEVKSANSYVAAIDRWQENKGEFDCIILDLNMKPDGIDEIAYSKYFPVHGIVFLNKICEEITPEEQTKIWEKTIIYSGYIDHFKDRKSDFNYFNVLTLIPKEATSQFRLLDEVKKMIK